MSRIKTAISGITTRPDHADGECRTLVNLRPSNGAWKPVPERKTINILSDDYDIIFVFRMNEEEDWIGIKGSKIFTSINTGSRLLLSDIDENINSVEQIGYTLSFITDSNVYYALSQDGTWMFLGILPDIPFATFIIDDRPFEMTPGEAIGTPVPSSTEEEYSNSIKAAIYVAMEYLTEGGTDEAGNTYEGQGQFLFDAHIIRYAFRLYDDSLVKYSPPILLMPSSHILTLKQLVYKVPWRTVKIVGYRPMLTFSETIPEVYHDIIKSIDIFISPPVGISNIENIIRKVPLELPPEIQNLPYYMNLINVITPKNIEQVKETGSLYFVDSIPIDEIPVAGSFHALFAGEKGLKPGERFKNLLNQDLMPNDNFSSHAIGATGSLTYNNRLRLHNTKTTFYKGFHPGYFSYDSSYNGSSSMSSPEGGGTRPAFNIDEMRAEVTLNAGGMTRKLVSTIVMDGSGKPNISSLLSYPDVRATEMAIYALTTMGSWIRLCRVRLIPHASFNLSYYLEPTLRAIGEKYLYEDPPEVNTENSELYEAGKLIISEIDNPFLFPAANTYRIGYKDILNQSSVAMNVTDRNYGQQPVFVFTPDGVYTMSGAMDDTVHQSVQAPTFLEPPISSVICATPWGVVFITNRGLMIIHQNGVEYISPMIRERGDRLEIDISEFTSSLIQYPLLSFKEYLAGINQMAYNPYNDELIISGPEEYSLVYDFPTKSFHISTHLAGRSILNTFPKVYLVSDRSVKDISEGSGKAADIAIMTRPLRFGAYDVKKLHRVMLRALMYNTEEAQVALYHSMDGVNFTPSKGYNFGAGKSYKDLDLGLLARQTYRQYIFVLTGTFDEETELRLLEFEIEKNYNDEKLR